MAGVFLTESGGSVLLESGAPVLVEARAAALANGRWRSVAEQSYAALPNYNTLSPTVGEVGFALFFNTSIALSPLISQMELAFTKPSGASLVIGTGEFFAGVDPIAGSLVPQRAFVAYIFDSGDLDEPGVWLVYLRYGTVPASGYGKFVVLPAGAAF
jgi:hypothetical protein